MKPAASVSGPQQSPLEIWFFMFTPYHNIDTAHFYVLFRVKNLEIVYSCAVISEWTTC